MKHYTWEKLVDRLFRQADALFDARSEMRRTGDVLQDAYDDATGLGPGLYGEPLLKETKDKLHDLDHAIGDVARQLEHLAREIKKGRR